MRITAGDSFIDIEINTIPLSAIMDGLRSQSYVPWL
jgi:hypothetical protein